MNKEKTESKEYEGKVTVTLKIPEPVYHFLKAAAETYDKTLEDLIVEELTQDVCSILNTPDDPRKILIGAFGLKPYIGA